MAALDFPASPTNGQVYQNWIYSTSKGAWQAKPMVSAKTVTDDVAPLNPADGDQWFSTVDGVLYIYVVDVDGGQWVESRSAIISDGYYSPNYVINGGMDIWQRGTSISVPNLGYSADRWFLQNYQTTTLSRQSTGLTGFQYCARYQRNSGTTTANFMYFTQSMESQLVTPLAGKTVTLSAYVRRGATSSADNSAVLQLYYGTGIDQNIVSGGMTGQAFVGGVNLALTTSWVRYSVTATVPANATQLAIIIGYQPTGTAGANEYIEVTGVQLEEGSVATPFRRNANSVAGELAACQRYYVRLNQTEYETTFGTGIQTSTTQASVLVPLPNSLRTAPWSITFYEVFAGDKSTVATQATAAATRSNADNLTLTISYGAFGAQFRPVMLQGRGTYPYNSYIEASSEL